MIFKVIFACGKSAETGSFRSVEETSFTMISSIFFLMFLTWNTQDLK